MTLVDGGVDRWLRCLGVDLGYRPRLRMKENLQPGPNGWLDQRLQHAADEVIVVQNVEGIGRYLLHSGRVEAEPSRVTRLLDHPQ